MKRLTILLLAVAGLATACSNNVFDLEVGQCFDDPDALTEVDNVDIVDCADPHDNEVYHVFDIPGEDYPGSLAVSEAADEGCLAAFPGFVGIDYASSRYVASSLQPSESSWNDLDDREVVCFLFDIDLAELTGSARNTAQ